ncbi:MAG: ribonuclease PH [Bdellovibrionales bacterium]|nr:ribonuclease PH [Bdellovibrionales bacterium]
MRTDGRNHDQLRPIQFTTDFTEYAEGSVLVKMGNTQVICTATIDEGVPKWMQGSGAGWLSAEYSMLPRSTHTRIKRDKATNSGRSQEISRLIGRSLRAALDLRKLGERQIYIDCDVIQADGGTRTAAINGGFVALQLAINFLLKKGILTENPIEHQIAAISVGIGYEKPLLDLNYDEDSNIETDMNFVLTNDDRFIEIQGTAEGQAFSSDQLAEMVNLAKLGCHQIFNIQKEAFDSY